MSIKKNILANYPGQGWTALREAITQRHEAAKNKTEVESLRRWEVGNPNLSDEAA